MDLTNKPLYALRDLAARLGVRAPTACTKSELLMLIEQRKKDIEENCALPNLYTRGRPRLNNCYIGIKKEDDGKLSFYESDNPPPANEYYDAKPQNVNITLKPLIEDKEIRNKLQNVKDLMDSLSLAITTVLER